MIVDAQQMNARPRFMTKLDPQIVRDLKAKRQEKRRLKQVHMRGTVGEGVKEVAREQGSALLGDVTSALGDRLGALIRGDAPDRSRLTAEESLYEPTTSRDVGAQVQTTTSLAANPLLIGAIGLSAVALVIVAVK